MVSVIIPTYRAEKYLSGLIPLLQKQTIPCEIIIIDSSSDDNTSKIAETFGVKTIVIKKQDFDHGGTRAFAGREAKGDILVFMTQDALLTDIHSIENLIQPLLKTENVAASFGRQLPFPDASPFGTHLRLFNYTDEAYFRGREDIKRFGIRTAFISNSFSAYKKKALEEIGWFRERLILGEDTCAAASFLQSGYEIAYVADATVYHSHNYSIFQDFKRYFDTGVFHKRENWLIEQLGRAEGEGKRYVKSEFLYLKSLRKYHLIPEFILRNGFKYLGYKLGRKYERLPKYISVKCSMHKGWWKET